MGKHGPCYHCGVTSTPLWRNGPPEKPVLCNACGSRWRTKGTLANYTPLHSRPEHDELVTGFSMSKSISTKNKGAKVLKRKWINDVGEFVVAPLDYSLGFHKVFDEETSNRSSSGSAISNSESCAQYGSADASELTGPYQPLSMWDSSVPSRKRTCVSRPKPSPVEKLTKDLYTIWHQQLGSCVSSCSEEDLLLESDKPMVSVEIGHGSVLIRHPSSITRDEESEASSLSFDNKLLNSRQVKQSPNFIEDTGANSLSTGIEKLNKPSNQGAVWRTTRENDQGDNLQILASHDSPLYHIDLQDVLNYEKFSSQLTSDEQQKLLNLLPPVDALEIPYSLKSMFNSAEFTENMLSFQKLLGDGVFDGSLCGVNSEDCRNLNMLILCDQKKSTWVQKYKDLKDSNGKSSSQSIIMGGLGGSTTTRLATMNGSRDGQLKKISGPRIRVKSPRRSIVKSIAEDFELIDKESSFSSTTSLHPLLNGDLDLFFHFNGESFEQDLLVDVPHNGSFPEAELLIPASGAAGVASSSSSTVYHTGFI